MSYSIPMPSSVSVKQEPLEDDTFSYASAVDEGADSPCEEETLPFEMVCVKMEDEDPLMSGATANEEVDDQLSKAPSPVSSHQEHSKSTEESLSAEDVKPTLGEDGVSGQAMGLSCPHCSEADLTEEEMKAHLLQHCEQDGKLYCAKCKFSTSNRTQYHNHTRYHTDQQLQCPDCPYVTWKRSEYRSHLRGHKNQGVICDTCGVTLKSHRNMGEHCRRMHSDLVTLWCPLCSFSTLMPDSFAKHKQDHDMGKPVLKCDDCDYITLYLFSLRRHKLVHRQKGPVKMLKCEECSFETKYSNSMLHHKKVHTEVRYNCKQCSFSSVYPNNLRQHMRLHEGEKLSCSLCSYQTARKDSLETHMRKHSEEQQFKCEECSFTTTYAASLRRHMIKIHHQVNPKVVTTLPGEKTPKPLSAKSRKRRKPWKSGEAESLVMSLEEKAAHTQSKLVSSDGEGEANVVTLLPDGDKNKTSSNKRRRRPKASSDGDD